MIKLTNITSGPKGIHAKDGSLVMIEPGATSDDIELGAGDLNTEWFKAAGRTDHAKPDYERDSLKDVDLHKPATTKDMLLVIAAYEQADVPQGDGATKADLIKAIEAKRAAD